MNAIIHVLLSEYEHTIEQSFEAGPGELGLDDVV